MHEKTKWTFSANYLVKKNVHIMLSGCSTGMTAPMAKIAADNEKLLIAPGSSFSKLYVNRSTVFAMFSPSTNCVTTATRAMAEKDVGGPVKKLPSSAKLVHLFDLRVGSSQMLPLK